MVVCHTMSRGYLENSLSTPDMFMEVSEEFPATPPL